jgi:hypothetical protein
MPANWTTPATWTTGQLVSASDLNTQVRDNLEYLKERTDAPGFAQYTVNETANYTTTSGVFVDVDSTKLALTIVTRGNPVMIGFYGTISSGAADTTINLDVLLDGTRIGTGNGMIQLRRNSSTFSGLDPVAFVHVVPTLAPGSHTFKLQWKQSGSSAVLYAALTPLDVHPQFWVREL